jgi:hypothetical protein
MEALKKFLASGLESLASGLLPLVLCQLLFCLSFASGLMSIIFILVPSETQIKAKEVAPFLKDVARRGDVNRTTDEHRLR